MRTHRARLVSTPPPARFTLSRGRRRLVLGHGLAFASLAALAAAAGAAGCGLPRSRRERVVIAVQPTSTPEQLSADAKDLSDFLSSSLGQHVQLVFPATYAGVIEALRFGHAHAAFMSAWPAALARKHAAAEVVLAEVREVVIDQDRVEAPYYFSYWVVRPESPFHTLEQLRGRRAAFPSQLSTSGYVAPLARLVQLGLIPAPAAGREADPRAFFGEVMLAGGYAQGWEALRGGQVDVTVIAGDVPERLYREVLTGTRVIERQGPIPSHGVVFGKELKEPLRTRLKEALLALGRPEHRPLMRKFVSGTFVSFRQTSSEEHLESLMFYLAVTRLGFTERMS